MSEAASSSVQLEEPRVARLLAATCEVIAEVPICWVVTPTLDGFGANARAVHDCTADIEGRHGWTRWFLTPPTSRKAAEIRRSGHATLAYQHTSGNAYVTLVGRAELREDKALVAAGLRRVADPDGSLAARLVAVRVSVHRVEVHVRGVTAEPWGQGRTLLECDEVGVWRLMPG
jgi:Pyridoxamine 5'-phosphate oxidase like